MRHTERVTAAVPRWYPGHSCSFAVGVFPLEIAGGMPRSRRLLLCGLQAQLWGLTQGHSVHAWVRGHPIPLQLIGSIGDDSACPVRTFLCGTCALPA